MLSQIILEYILKSLDLVIIIVFLLGFFFIDLYFRKKIYKIKSEINKKYSEDELEKMENMDSLDQDLYIEYYKGKNILNLMRFVIIFSGIVIFILIRIPGIFSFLAIAVGAIIITFKELILSFFGFFYISTKYKIGENIIVGDIRGEIIYINILNIGLIGKNEHGEHNGQFYSIPNFKLVLENVKKEELSPKKYKKDEIEIYYNQSLFKLNFENFLEELKNFLDTELVKRNINNVGNYKTYIGYKYKLRFKYEKEYLIIKVSIIEKPRVLLDIQDNLISFVETFKKEK